VGLATVQSRPRPETGRGTVVAVIDNGFELVHQAFRDGEDSRILAVLDQTVGYPPGTVYDRAALAKLMAKTTNPVGPDPNHGTMVASIAAGRPFTTPGGATTYLGGMAPDPHLIFVVARIDNNPGDPASIGYSKAHLDALQFITDTLAAETDPAIRDAPVVVNVSAGMNAGSHDGTSLLEAGFDNFGEGGRKPGRLIVMSAGNLRRRHLHARVYTLLGGEETVEWESSTFGRDFDIIEGWFPTADVHQFFLIDPAGAPGPHGITPTVFSARNRFPGGEDYSMALTRYHHDNGACRLLVTIERSG
jgi:endonuclease G